ncbi:MAG TPA: carboxypeptidase-like regulatory domain-containing protein, partial [Polyangiaceae bacterium]
DYQVDAQTQRNLNWNLGNAGSSTLLPVHVTYRPLWPTTSVTAASVQAQTLGFPVYDVSSTILANPPGGLSPGPNGNPSPLYQATLPAGAYEMTIQPDPPFDAAFPPLVQNVTLSAGSQLQQIAMVVDDTHRQSDAPQQPNIPQFIVQRTTTLAGWTAYLRDVTTLERISSAPTLTAAANTVTLATNHKPPDGDALTNAELVVHPPSGSTSPTYVVPVAGNDLPYHETVPDLPAPVAVSGALTDVDGVTPLEGDLVFEVHPSASPQQGLYVAGAPTALNTTNFDLVVRTHASSAAEGGPSTYSVTLPPGTYQLTVIPADAVHAVTVNPAFPVPVTTSPLVQAVPAGALRTVRGSAALADGRPLSGAVVEVVPTACAQATGSACMPRGAQTTTDSHGSFTLSLDPGTYALAVEPAQGSRFPWATQTLLVGPTDVVVSPVV